ncbi:MAG: DUF1549 domain-containing protein [Isosphaeraceae bacterium]|nr:DUF1549 domain-containing protein [Isosphaeraceae bacterium]
MNRRAAALGAALILAAAAPPSLAAEVLRPASERYSAPEVQEVPDFQRHILPLMGRLGCNGRACHGSFQGQGGFRLSLFGYDFKMDHEALLKEDSGRVDPEAPEISKILMKPTLTIPHKGGKRMEVDSWQYRMFYRWIEAGAKGVETQSQFDRLEVIPSEIVFQREGEKVPLRVIAHWADGTSEDVTCITRYRTNDESIAEVNEDGVVTSLGKGDTHVVAFYDNGVAVAQVLRPVSDKVGPNYPDTPTPTKIDELVVAKLRKLGIVPSGVCSDAEFLRRVSLDLTGTLPTPEEIEAFLADPSPNKRETKVDELLARPTYAAWWTTKLCDITGNSIRNFQGQPSPDRAARQWYEWIYRRVQENTPYDQLIAGIVLATSRRPGQSYEDFAQEQSAYFRDKDPADFSARETMPYYWAKRTVRKPEERALNFSYTFLGVRLECAQCHKHPFDQWTQDDFNQFTAFFNTIGYGNAPDSREAIRKLREDLGLNQKAGNQQKQLTEAVREGKVIPWPEVFLTRNNAMARLKGKKVQNAKAGGRVVTPKLLGGDEVALSDYDDPRAPLMEWMRRKDNPYFARAFVNRVWANYFGSGIVNPPDDLNLANPPSNAALLDYLVAGFLEHGYDMKWLHREIVTSQTYQRSWQVNETNQHDERNYSHALVRRLPAEVLLDAVTQATANQDALARATTDLEPRAIGPRAAAGLNRAGRGNDYAARVFGASSRDTNCDCNRSNEPNLLQSIYLQNDQETLAAIERKDGWLTEFRASRAKQAKSKAKGTEEAAEESLDLDALVRDAFLRTLSRRPTEPEAQRARAYLEQADDEAKGLRDLLWALLNTKEFITNH